MSVFFIGDVQGCYDQLMALLELIQFDPAKDQLGFVGDLVNRGPKSLEVLRFIKSLNDPIVVLGNHDLYLLAVGLGARPMIASTTIGETLKANDCEELLEWLRQQKIFHVTQDYCCVHAGIPPQWSIQKAQRHAKELEAVLHGERETCIDFLKNMYGDTPTQWHDDLTGYDRLRYITNAFTRMRFCSASGALELDTKNKTQSNDPNLKPWFNWPTPDIDIIFGHWAALRGQCSNPRCYAIDTGCAWGESLTAIEVETKALYSV
ncbi:MAG: symmetrical bis(5'-nucleosyl)-tetraphosphatase [Gammaproteobacteria bacterium]|nr:symmetrical bis(5'-nucleosyl)-tetraphosphatase [Gammaproteobacteria bacterium]MCH9743835.1 symmetrical bis(5'-nucleosyl)-tetraphosphatase [Gammaproteobacteria bacterium]